MKKATLSTLAAALMLSMPAFADDAHHPGQAGAMPGGSMQLDGKTMQMMRSNLATMQQSGMPMMPQCGPAKPAN